MIDRDGQHATLVCDDATESFLADDFAAMMSAFRLDGRRSFKRDGAWYNACPDCVELWVDGMKQRNLFDPR